MIVYVRNQNHEQICSGRAWQRFVYFYVYLTCILYISVHTQNFKNTKVVCERDQYGRPIAILINFCDVKFTNGLDDEFEDNMPLLLHEFTHGLVMNYHHYGLFRNRSTGEEYDDIFWNDTNGKTGVSWMITSEVKNITAEHFACTGALELPGVMMEPGNYHWHSRMLNSEIMSGDGMYRYISKFTFALFHDSGWYSVSDYDFAQPFFFGYHQGCNFIHEDCVDKETHRTAHPQYWCDGETDR